MTEDEKQRIRSLFVMVLRLIKTESEASIKLSSELASVLGAVHSLDPTFQDVLGQRRAQVDQITDPVIRADAGQFDDIIRQVESGEFL